MWIADKIELEKNREGSYQEDGFILKINGEWISNEITTDKVFKRSDWFQSCVCDYCGHAGCNPTGILMARYDGDKLLIIPSFDDMETWEEYSSTDSNGDVECPPHKWFTDGILQIEGKMLTELLSKVSGFEKDKVKSLTEEDSENIRRWEQLVLDKPIGFIHEYYLSDIKS